MRGLMMYSKEVMPSVRCPVVNQGVLSDKYAQLRLCIVSKESLQFDE